MKGNVFSTISMILGGRINNLNLLNVVFVASPLHPSLIRPGILSSHRSNVGTRGRSLDPFKRRVSFDGTEAGLGKLQLLWKGMFLVVPKICWDGY